VYQEPAQTAAKELKGRVEVVFPTMQPGEVRNTNTALEKLDQLLGEGRWDVIHFNFGLGDIVHRAPNMKAFRVMAKNAGGVLATSPERYEKNLHELVKRLKATGAKLVWASTTPIRSAPNGIFDLGKEVQYNAIAARVMAEHNVPINDMYTYVREIIDMDRPAPHGWDPFHFDKKPIHGPIVKSLLDQLELKPVVGG
jgi:hypothetical protein